MLLPIVGMADSISPETFSTTLNVGESTTIKKLVTVTEGTPTSAKVDVFFLTDSTGSMGGLINAVKTSASDILNNTSGLGDVAFGVGEYKDIFDTFTYRMNQDITTDTAAAQAGINQWFAAGGDDIPEANLHALEQVATTASWRDDSTRILVWFGDEPGQTRVPDPQKHQLLLHYRRRISSSKRSTYVILMGLDKQLVSQMQQVAIYSPESIRVISLRKSTLPLARSLLNTRKSLWASATCQTECM